MLKYTNEIIEKDVKEKGWILININGVGKMVINIKQQLMQTLFIKMVLNAKIVLKINILICFVEN